MSRAKNEPDYDFGPYEDEYRGFEIRDDETGRGPLILVLALGVLLIFAGVVWNTYRQGVRTTEGGLPVIVSDSDNFKRSPDERGGVEVAGQDKAYYGSMDGLGDPALQKTSARNPLDIRRRNAETLAGGPAELPPIEGADEAPKIVYAEAVEADSIETEPETPIQIAVAKPVRETVIDATIQESSPSELSVSRFVAAGTYQVQLSALRSEDAAQSAWKSLQNTAPDLYAGAELDIQRADLGAKGVFYRLRIGSFADRATAKGFCADVKATGKDCMVVAKAIG
ncbi:MAG: SPOR domain-containing protein [Henriciella sp.]